MNRSDATSTRVDLWFAFLAGPLAWAFHETLSYALVKLACETGLIVLLDLVTLITVAIACLGIMAAIRTRGLRVEPPRGSADLLAAAAIVMDALFVFAILMEAAPDLVVSPCL